MGGMIPAIERNYPQQEIADASYRYQRELESGARTVVGVTAFTRDQEPDIELLRIDESAAQRQQEKLDHLRHRRNQDAVHRALDNLQEAAHRTDNLMPFLLEAVRAYATVGEVCEALAQVFDRHQEKAVV